MEGYITIGGIQSQKSGVFSASGDQIFTEWGINNTAQGYYNTIKFDTNDGITRQGDTTRGKRKGIKYIIKVL